MSYARRWGGRFTTNTASEAYQRQLTAPVHKWRKAWVAPSGLQPESSYKICKWVRVDQAADEDFANEGDEEDEDEGDEGDENEGEDGDDGDEGGEEGEGEGEGGEEVEAPKSAEPPVIANGAEGAGEAMEVDPPAPVDTLDVPPITTGTSTPAAPSPTPAVDLASPHPEGTPSGMAHIASPHISPAPPATSTLEPPIHSRDPSVSPQPASGAISPASNVFSPKPQPHSPPHELPANAIEIHNVAPGGTELGLGDLGEGGGGVEITHPELKSPSIPLPDLPAEEAMEDGDVQMGEPDSGLPDAEDRDPGLTMADHEPERDFAVEGADEPREIAKDGE